MTGDRPGPAKDERAARQAAALRDNLLRRKAQLRARREAPEPAVETPLAPDPPPG